MRSSVKARELAAIAVFAGPPSVAHAEALLRGVERRGSPARRAGRRARRGVPWSRCTCRASRSTRSRRPRSASGTRSASGATPSRSATAGRRPRSTFARTFAHGAGAVPRALRRSAREARRRGSSPPRDGSGGRRRARSPRIAGDVPAIRSSPTPTGPGARPSLARSGRVDRRREPRRGRRADARVRPEPLDRERTRDGSRRRGWTSAGRGSARPAVRAAPRGRGAGEARRLGGGQPSPR